MKKKSMKKVICIAMAFAMIFNLTACSSNSKTTEGEVENARVSENTETGMKTDTETENELVTFDIYIDHPWFWLDTWGEDPVSQQITTETGVTFNVTRATDAQQLALLIAAGDLPDIVYTATTSTMALLADSEVCYSYNELVDKTGVDIHATETEVENNTVADGNYYALLNAYISQEAIDAGNTLISGGASSIAYRTDIYEAIGSPEIKTIEDLENALLASKEMYPDIIPLLNSVDYTGYFEEQLGIVKGEIGYNSAGEACYRLNKAGIEDYFSLLNRFAREGLLSSEAQTYNYDKFCEIRNSGKSFMQLRAGDEAISSNNAALEAGTGYTWKLLTNDLSDNALVDVTTGIGWSGTYITKNCSDPEKAIEFISWCRSEEGRKLCSWGIQGEHWDYNEDGETVTTKTYREAIAEGKDRHDEFGIGVWIFGDQGDENAFVDHAATDPDQIDYNERLQNGTIYTANMSELYFAIPTSGDELNYYNALNDMYDSEVLKVIFAETDEEYQSALDSMYRQAEQIGIDKLEEWMRNSIAEYLK